MRFKDVVGQEKIKKKLIESYRLNRLSHAQLFSGDLGFGALPLALAFIQFIACLDKEDDDSCGKCTSCLKMNKIAHPDLHFSFPVNSASDSKKKLSDDFLAEWREMLLDNPYFELKDWQQKIEVIKKQCIINVAESQNVISKLNLKSFESEYKFLLIWKAEKLNIDAANKLLKLIEEPTDKTLIFLIAENSEDLIKTIRSRTQIIQLSGIERDLIANYLQHKLKLEPKLSIQLGSLSNGSITKAIERLQNKEEQQLFFNWFKAWMRNCYQADVEKMVRWVDELSLVSHGRLKQMRFLEYCLGMVREGMLLQYGGQPLLQFQGEEELFIKKFAPFVHENNLIQMMELINEAHTHISRNAYAKVVFMDMSMRFANLLHFKKRKFVN